MNEGLDLFGQVAVTWPEVVEWVARVAGITPDSPRFMNYVQAWRVAEKIAQARAWQAFEASGTNRPKPPGSRDPAPCTPGQQGFEP